MNTLLQELMLNKTLVSISSLIDDEVINQLMNQTVFKIKIKPFNWNFYPKTE